MFEAVKRRLGIVEAIVAYDADIQLYIGDCVQDMIASGVPETVVNAETEAVLTAVTLYVSAYLGNDRTDTEKYLDLYRKKVFRLTLEPDGGESDVE